jgi:putative phosphoribosyl transferase
MITRFKDRADAGRQLALLVRGLREENVIVIALPRGGVPVAYEVARSLNAPLDVLNVRKLRVPWREEIVMGAIAPNDVRVLNNEIIMAMDVSKASLEEVTSLQRVELDRRERVYRYKRTPPVLRGRTVLLVDDGIASGASVRAAISVIRTQHPARLVLAVPVVQDSVAGELRRDVDDLACVHRPTDLFGIRTWYDHFPEVTDQEVRAILSRAGKEFSSRTRVEPHIEVS